jgi:cobalt-zinc-cadmium efflux system outer membrane protein
MKSFLATKSDLFCCRLIVAPILFLVAVAFLSIGLNLYAQVPASAATCPGPVSLQQACALALEHHPDLRSIPMERRIVEARRLGATRWPNPSAEFEMEDFSGSGPYAGTRSTIFTGLIVQTIELGGKGTARKGLAAAQGTSVEAKYKVLRRRTVLQTTHRFVDALATREMLALAESEVELARQNLASVKAQAEAGRATDSQMSLAAMSVTRAALAAREAQRNAQQALVALAAQWDCRTGAPPRVIGELAPPVRSLPSRDKSESALENHPEISVAISQAQEKSAELRLVRSERYPDIDLAAGGRHDNTTDDQAVVVGLTIPLPFFNLQTDKVQAVEAGLEQAQLEVDNTRRNLAVRFDAAWTDLANSHDTATTVEESLLPVAKEVFARTQEAYELGKSSFLELIEARRQLNEVNSQWVEARRDYHKAVASVQGLTGMPF